MKVWKGYLLLLYVRHLPFFSFFFKFYFLRQSLYVVQAGLELNPSASASRVLELQVCATTTDQTSAFMLAIASRLFLENFISPHWLSDLDESKNLPSWTHDWYLANQRISLS
jgi:hypothetical protein